MTQTGTGSGIGYPPAPRPGPTGPVEPTPPRGPGVVAPFPAPPRERNPRIWIGLLAAALVLVLCVGGGVAGFVAFAFHLNDQVKSTVDVFLTQVEDEHYDSAYKLQCSAARQRQSADEFTAQFTQGSKLVRHDLAAPESVDVGGASAFSVRATLFYGDGHSDEEEFVVVAQGAGNSDLAVCGVTR